ncbi:MAG: hypothetical protein ACXVBH_00020 [Flavisolibacter sp.]
MKRIIMEERELSQQESLLLIEQMIQAAKKEQKDDGTSWIVWGWMLFAASGLTIANLHFQWYNTYFFWDLFGLAAVAIFIYKTIKVFFLKKPTKVRTYTKELFDRVNAGFFISLMLIIVAMNAGLDPSKSFALLISLYAFWILIYGSALNFKPSIIGAYITWVFAIVALFVKTFELVMVMHASGVLFGYIIPGHIAYKEFKKIHRQEKLAELV